jgi:hypothetical protein
MYFKKFYEQLPLKMIQSMEDGKRNSMDGGEGKISGGFVAWI